MDLLRTLMHFFQDGTRPSPIPVPPIDITKQLLDAHNNERVARDLPRFRVNNKLVAAATKHAKWMCENHQISHIGVGSSSLVDRLNAEDYLARSVAENVASGYTSVATVMAGWMASGCHRRSIFASYMEVGFGRVGNYWCALYAIPGVSRDDTITIHYSGPLGAPLCG